jgi:hypothetical protein
MAGEPWQVEVKRLDGRIDGVDKAMVVHIDAEQKMWERNSETHKDLYGKLDRPSWAVTVILALLSSSTVGLMVYSATR